MRQDAACTILFIILWQRTVLIATDVPKPVVEDAALGGTGDSGPVACAGGDIGAPGMCSGRRLQALDMRRMIFY